MLQEWLNSCDIKYTEGLQSLYWSKIMEPIVNDPDGFFESGEWNFLDPESGDEDDSDEDETFAAPGSDEGGSGGAWWLHWWRFWDFSDDDASEDNFSEEQDSDERSGKDWSDLEAEAAEDGRNRGDDDGDRRKGGNSSSSCRDRDRYVFLRYIFAKVV